MNLTERSCCPSDGRLPVRTWPVLGRSRARLAGGAGSIGESTEDLTRMTIRLGTDTDSHPQPM